MRTLIVFLIALPVFLLSTLASSQNTRFSDPDTVVENEFWGKLYAQGGTSFFCETPFTSKGFLLTDGYIYPLAQVRSALDCGTSSQCANDNRYRQIASDLHNIVPVRSRTEMRRRNALYEELGTASKADECGIRESAQFFEPPEKVKGDIARTVAYMVDTYDLPWAGATRVFKSWNRMDPPDDRELTRHRQIAEIQGNENPFVLDPGKLDNL
ncbi:endonuclease [Marinobacter sp. HL-58]|uniref:endonuclease n=1 Tax=Marinobacter sp. HL-58 TaxID=1479237 RepID=UPI000484D4F9|nr:endonuclease [Marinobacter sp. HL-58]KPP99812.1 MAG: deoxyribonuclease I EndA [Marinobacter sp. HL-58]